MKSRVLQIALQIALIKEQFTEKEILEAVKLLEEQNTSSALLAHLSACETQPKNSKESGRKSKPINEQWSKTVKKLESNDPEKFGLLSDFEKLLRQRKVFPKLNDVRRLGGQLSKDFAPRKSRREVISQVMTLLVGKPIEEIEKIVKDSVPTTLFDDDESEYQQLARFIITGKKNSQDKDEARV
jgi:hypothetical protein